MGTTTKGILLSGIYMMLGMFTMSFNNADETNSKNAIRQAQFVEAEQYARLGISMATGSSTFMYTNWSNQTKNYTINGTTIKVDWIRPGGLSQASISSTVNIIEMQNVNDVLTPVIVGRVITSGKYNYYNGRWRNAGIYTKYENL